MWADLNSHNRLPFQKQRNEKCLNTQFDVIITELRPLSLKQDHESRKWSWDRTQILQRYLKAPVVCSIEQYAISESAIVMFDNGTNQRGEENDQSELPIGAFKIQNISVYQDPRDTRINIWCNFEACQWFKNSNLFWSWPRP